jgi:3-dehydrosphinganine reductase
MPAGIDTPGFVEEEKEKPKVTKKIEEDDKQISPEKCAEYLIAGTSSLLISLYICIDNSGGH